MNWRIAYTRRAERDLRAIDPPVVERVQEAIERLAATGQGDVARLRGYSDRWRLRVGPWRVLFAYDFDTRTISVLTVGHRREAYRR